MFVKKIFLLMLSAFYLSLSGCNSGYDYSKFDSPLSEKFREIERSGKEEQIQFFINTSLPPNDEMKKQITNTGVTIETVIGNIITARGYRNQIGKLSQLDFVRRLELSVNRKLN